MYRIMLKSKIHRACVTDANLDYQGSITIDRALMDAVDLREDEKVLVANLTNGKRIETYVIPAERGSKTICINGAAAHKFSKGDRIIVMAFSVVGEEELQTYQPRKIALNERNEVI